MCRLLALVPLLAALAFAAITNLQVIGVTPTQAVIAYTAPDERACRVEISESPSLTPLVHDVDAVLFSGSDSDMRPEGVSAGRDRKFPAGTRRAQKAPDGLMYSRALQAYTKHYYRITCGPDQATGDFQTANIALGNTAPDPPPFDPNGVWNYAWPSLSLTDQAGASTVDPLTGTLLKRMTFPGPAGSTQSSNTNFNWALDISGQGNWTNLANAVGSSGSASTASTDPVFIGWDAAVFRPMSQDAGGFQPSAGISDIQISVTGNGSDASAANRTMAICMTEDSGQTCKGTTQYATLGTTTSTVTTSPSFPSQNFADWGFTPGKWEWGPRYGVASASNGVLAYVSGNYFPQDWTTGTMIFVANSDPTCEGNFCTVRATPGQDATQVTLQENLTLGNGTYKTADAGFRVWKTNAAGTVNARFQFKYAQDWLPAHAAGGEFSQCDSRPISVSVDAAGNPITPARTAYQCIFGYLLFAFFPDNGEFRLVSLFHKRQFVYGAQDAPTGTGGLGYFSSTAFGSSTRDFVALENVYGRPGQMLPKSLFKGHYGGDYRAYKPAGPNGLYYPIAFYNDGNLTWTNLTPTAQNLDINTQLDAWFRAHGYSGLPAPWWIYGSGTSIDNYYAISHGAADSTRNYGMQDTPCMVEVFDTSQNPALLVQHVDTYSSPELRWAGCHTNVGGERDYLQLMTAKQLVDSGIPSTTHYLSSSWQFQVRGLRRQGEGSAWDANTSLGASEKVACPPTLDQKWKDLGATGTACVYLRATEPCGAVPCSTGTNVADSATCDEIAQFSVCPWNAAYSFLQPMAEGDWITDPAGSNSGEKMRIVRKRDSSQDPTLGPNEYEIVVQRSVLCGSKSSANGWYGVMSPTSVCRSNTAYLDKTTFRWVIDMNPAPSSAHLDSGAGEVAGSYTTMSAGHWIKANAPWPTGFTTTTPGWYSINTGNTKFANGPAAGSIGSNIQSYPSKRQIAAPSYDQRWGLDANALLPSTGTAAESSAGLWNRTVSAVAGTAQVYKIGVAGTLEVKRSYLEVWAGRWNLGEKSGPGSTLTDSNAWRYCVAYKAGECVSGSSANDVYVNVPHLDANGSCLGNQYFRNVPCAAVVPPYAAWFSQWDVSRPDARGVSLRRMTMGYSGPGRQYMYANWRPFPDGSWAMVEAFWLDGIRPQEYLAAKLPPVPDGDSTNRATFVPVPVRIGALPAGATGVIVRFGYNSRFECTGRAEACVANAVSASGEPAIVESAPFAFETSDNPAPLSCAGGCSVVIPGLSQRTLYYQVLYSNGTAVIAGGKTELTVVP